MIQSSWDTQNAGSMFCTSIEGRYVSVVVGGLVDADDGLDEVEEPPPQAARMLLAADADTPKARARLRNWRRSIRFPMYSPTSDLISFGFAVMFLLPRLQALVAQSKRAVPSVSEVIRCSGYLSHRATNWCRFGHVYGS